MKKNILFSLVFFVFISSGRASDQTPKKYSLYLKSHPAREVFEFEIKLGKNLQFSSRTHSTELREIEFKKLKPLVDIIGELCTLPDRSKVSSCEIELEVSCGNIIREAKCVTPENFDKARVAIFKFKDLAM